MPERFSPDSVDSGDESSVEGSIHAMMYPQPQVTLLLDLYTKSGLTSRAAGL